MARLIKRHVDERDSGVMGKELLRGVSVLIDLTSLNEDVVPAYVSSISESLSGVDCSLYLIVRTTPDSLAAANVTYVEADEGFDQVERASLALQMVRTSHFIYSNRPVVVSPYLIDEVARKLVRSAVVSIELTTEASFHGAQKRIHSSRTVCFGMRFAFYAYMRGFDLRIRTFRDAFNDLSRRVKQMSGSIGTLVAESHVAQDGGPIERPRPQTYEFWRSNGVFVNLPRWRFMPFYEPRDLKIVRVNPVPTSGFDASKCQSIDGSEVVDLFANENDQVDALKDYCVENPGTIIAPVASSVNVLPDRLLEQIQHIRSAQTYVVGGTVTMIEGQIQLVRSDSRSFSSTGVDLEGLSAVCAPSEVIVKLITGDLGGLRRANTKAIVAAATSTALDGSGAVPVQGPLNAQVTSYLNHVAGDDYMIFDQYPVGRVDYINGYDRIAGVVALVDENGSLICESAAVRNPSAADLLRLSRLGLQFKLVSPGRVGADICGYMADITLDKYVRQRCELRQVRTRVGRDVERSSSPAKLLYVRPADGEASTFEVLIGSQSRSGPDIRIGLHNKSYALWDN